MQLFLYGTLKRDRSNHSYLAGQRYLGDAQTPVEYAMHDFGGYPGMVRTEEAPLSIQGEVWEVDAACLTALDELEGLALGEYERVPIALLPPWDEALIQTYLYLLPLGDAPRCGPIW
jgi:gamma-glutamylaminecyclotransferase